ncbi:MAG: glycosyltransferase family 2 protein [Lachnospiraceae bacterium]
MMEPKVSIIIPVYNVEPYLRRCLDSIVNQTFDSYEIICVNDCSPDNSQFILDEYSGKYPDRIRVLVNEENIGAAKSRERGIADSRGSYLMFIDSDDYIANDYIEVYYSAICKDDLDVVVAGYTKDIDGKLIKHIVADSQWSLVTYAIGCAKMYRKQFIVDHHIEFPDIRCGEDIYFCMSLFYHNPKYAILDYTGYYYYYNRKSTTSTIDYEKKHEEFVAKIYSMFLEKHDLSRVNKNTYEVIEYSYLANMVNALITYGRGGGIHRMKNKYKFFKQDLIEKFPDYRKNSFVGIFKPKGQTVKIRLGVGVTMTLEKIGLDRMIYYIISLF